MSLNIKNEEAHRIAAELAAIRGVSMTVVVVEALRKELEEEQRKRFGKTKAERILEAARRFQEGLHSSEHAVFYGEDGIPH